MELKPGYKQTEVGVIPEDWNVSNFANFLEFKNGVNAQKQAYGKGIPFINVLEVLTNAHIHSSEIKGRITLSKGSIELYSVRKGDLIFNRTSETQDEVGLASVYMDDVKVVFGGFVIRGRPKSDLIHPIYSGYALRSPAIRSQIVATGQGVIRANISQAELRKILVALPSLPEQRAIAAALSDTDALISGLDRLIAKKRDIKQAVMQQLLTGKQRLPGFSGEWEVKRLGEIASMGSGGTPSSKIASYYDGNICWASVADMTSSGKYVFNTERNLTLQGLQNSSAQLLPIGTILYAMYASIGECSIAAVEISSSQAILGIRVGDKIIGDYLYFYLASKKAEVKQMGQQGTQSNINKGIVENFRILLPSIKEQTAIVAVLSDIDAEIAALEKRRDKTILIKQGMMQELLTGRTRLV